MYPIRKKAGYLEGLVAAMKLDENNPADQLTSGMVSLLSDLAERVEAFEDLLGELNDYVQSIDDDLTELEGMRDDDDDELFDVQASPADEPFRVIENFNSPAPRKMQIPARCPECAAVFLIDLPGGQYICPVCEKTVIPQRLSEKNTPIAKRREN